MNDKSCESQLLGRHLVVLVDQAPVAQRLNVFVSYVEARFGVLSADEIADEVLGVEVDRVKALVRGDHGEEPQAPCQVGILVHFEKFVIEDADEGGRGLGAVLFLAASPALQGSGLAAHLLFELDH